MKPGQTFTMQYTPTVAPTPPEPKLLGALGRMPPGVAQLSTHQSLSHSPVFAACAQGILVEISSSFLAWSQSASRCRIFSVTPDRSYQLWPHMPYLQQLLSWPSPTILTAKQIRNVAAGGRGIHCLGLDHEGTNCRAEAWGSMEASKDAEVRCGSIPTVAGSTYHITSYPILSYHIISYHIISHSASVGRKH